MLLLPWAVGGEEFLLFGMSPTDAEVQPCCQACCSSHLHPVSVPIRGKKCSHKMLFW